MPMKKLLFVYNAKSGKARIKRYLSDIINIFIQSGYYVESYQTQSVSDAKKQIAGRGQHFDLIVVAGGDGTLNEGISGMMQEKFRLAIFRPVQRMILQQVSNFQRICCRQRR